MIKKIIFILLAAFILTACTKYDCTMANKKEMADFYNQCITIKNNTSYDCNLQMQRIYCDLL